VDATPQEREIREVFPSYYCFKVEDLLLALSRLKNENKKGEYYLTDTYGILRDAGRKVVAVQAVGPEDVLGVNDREQLAAIDAIMQDRIQRQLRAAGVTITSPVNTYVEAGVTIGPDTVVQPFTQIGRDSSIGAECTIGPFALLPPESIVPDGSVVSGNVAAEVPLRAGR
jgi:bifunctional UDP-N-acetylglucosamine pyrophosphorylase/glucosamine-1-phosphate N-acetyltransferase